MRFDDTIAAISTPVGKGGISVIRLSGKDAIEIADRVFKNNYGKTLKNAPTHTVTHGFAVRGDGTVIDEVLCTVMLAPRSYTRENVAEISCHGGIVSTRDILSAVLGAGARLADAGEFTKRAFLNGRMDLAEAEAVIDIINAKTSNAHSLSVHQLRGKLSERISKIRENLLSLTAHLQVLIDFADEDLEPLTDDEFTDGLKSCLCDIRSLAQTSDRGRIIREGVPTVIAGKPNVGKSSLLNLLCGDDRAIVTDIAGTTRDTIEETVNIGRVMLSLTDTAGIRETDDAIEKIGVEKSREALKESELVIFVTDAMKELDESDRYIMECIKDKNTIVLINKAENGIKADMTELYDIFQTVIEFSAKEGLGLDKLGEAIDKMFDVGDIASSDEAIISNVRHRDALRKAEEALGGAIDAIELGMEPNVTFVDIEDAISALGEITGQTVGEEIVDRIFHSFCVGK